MISDEFVEKWKRFIATFQRPEDVWTCLALQDEPSTKEPEKEIVRIDDSTWMEDVIINGLNAKATVYSCCGYTYQTARVSCQIDRGHVNGEYGDKPKKNELKEMLLWGLRDSCDHLSESCWRVC